MMFVKKYWNVSGEAAVDGGYMIATDHSIHDLIPTENVRCLIDTINKYGKYPIDLTFPADFRDKSHFGTVILTMPIQATL